MIRDTANQRNCIKWRGDQQLLTFLDVEACADGESGIGIEERFVRRHDGGSIQEEGMKLKIP
jgi:hypothetical protein